METYDNESMWFASFSWWKKSPHAARISKKKFLKRSEKTNFLCWSIKFVVCLLQARHNHHHHKAKICVAYRPQQCNVVMRGRHNVAQIYLWYVTLWPSTRAQQKHADADGSSRLLKTKKSNFFSSKLSNAIMRFSSIHWITKVTFWGLKKSYPKKSSYMYLLKAQYAGKDGSNPYGVTRFYNIFYVLSCFCVANTGAQHKTTQRPWCSCLAFSSR